jgi:hypothetical protein
MRSRTGSGVNVRDFNCCRVSPKKATMSASSEMNAGITRSTPAVRGPLISPHPFPRDREEIRVINEVEQIIEPAARILGRPKVQLGLHPPYPLLRQIRIRPQRPPVFTSASSHCSTSRA